MFKQTEDKYKHIMLGFGFGSLYSFGCYLFSLVNGLLDFDWKYTPEEFNQFLKDNQAFTGEFNNYIDVDRLDDILPNIFVSYKRFDEWIGFDSVDWYLSRGYIVIGKVDARGIGGSGSHFVRVVDTVNKTNTIIEDPWFGTTEPVTNNYNKYNNILGFRIFKVNRNVPSTNETMQSKLFEKYGVKDETELDYKINEHCGTDWGGGRDSGFLGSAREDVKNLRIERDGLKTQRDEAETELREFKRINSNALADLSRELSLPGTDLIPDIKGAVTRLIDEKNKLKEFFQWCVERIDGSTIEKLKAKILTLLSIEDKLNAANKQLENKDKDFAKKEIVWQAEIDELRRIIDKMTIRLEKLEQKIEDGKKEKIENEWFQNVLDKILSIFKGK